MTAVDSLEDPKVKQANEILAEHAPNIQPGYYPYLGMAGAIAFHKAAEAAGKDLTRAKLIAALENLGRWKPGVTPPLNWGPKNHAGPTTFGYVQWVEARSRCCRGGNSSQLRGRAVMVTARPRLRLRTGAIAITPAICEQVCRILKGRPQRALLLGSVKLAAELDRLDLIDGYKFLVYPRIVGHGPTLYESGLPSARQLELVSTKPLRNGVVVMHHRRFFDEVTRQE